MRGTPPFLGVCCRDPGVALPDAARSMRVAEQTARGYLKQIFAKTNTHRQTDLTRLLIPSPAHRSIDRAGGALRRQRFSPPVRES